MNRATESSPSLASLPGVEADELAEWQESLDDFLARHGPERTGELLAQLTRQARQAGVPSEAGVTTPYVNTIPATEQPPFPGDRGLERRIRSLIRWNSMAMVVRSNRLHAGIGGHISSYASLATLSEIGFNHFFHARTDDHPGDLVYLHGHSSPGIYARAYLEGRLQATDLERFRQEVPRETGLSSYPHPWLMPTFWQFPTVSMGLGPLQAVYQAHLLRYVQNRSLAETSQSRVWCFLGDGECDEPESLGNITLAAREHLDNLTFVVNCNLQRLDGPVRGNGKIIQELEGVFRGAGWHVIKVIWGSDWDPLLDADEHGLLRARMEEVPDGQYQKYSVSSGAYIRDHFFGTSPELRAMVEHLSDDQLRRLNRGGHDPAKVYAAYQAAVEHRGQPTVILAKTIKGYGLGAAGEGQNVTHKANSLNAEQLKAFRTRFDLPLADERVDELPFYKPSDDSPELSYLRARRRALGGNLPARATDSPRLTIPPLEEFGPLITGGGDTSTTTSFGRLLRTLMKHEQIGPRMVPIIPDEARTFGLETLFAQYGIYNSNGQQYEPVDAHQLIHYHEARDGQLLEMGISEAGAMAAFLAAGTSYSTLQLPLVPCYLFYSMFGYQRVGDLIWAAADARAKGFLLGCTAGRTTLSGEGLQHQDGHSPLLTSVVPTLQIYDPAYAYEVAVIVQDGLRRMYQEQESIFYYLTLYNEFVESPPLPPDARDGILRGMYLLRGVEAKQPRAAAPRLQLFGSGTLLQEAKRAQELLADGFQLSSDLWSVTSYNQLRREALAVERQRRLDPESDVPPSYLEQTLGGRAGPFIAVTDYMQIVPDQIRRWVPGPFVTLGTDGFGRSDTREVLRAHFEINAEHIAWAALATLAQVGQFDLTELRQARELLRIDPHKPDPVTL